MSLFNNLEYDLEKELERSHIITEDEIDNSNHYNYNGLLNIIYNDLNYSSNIHIQTIYSKKNIDNKIILSLHIERYGDIIKTLFLQIEKNENFSSFEDLELDKIQSFFNSEISLFISGIILCKRTILVCLFEALILGYTISEDESYIQIPLFIFDIEIYKFSNDEIIKGLPIISLHFSSIKITIECNKNISFIFNKISQKGYTLQNIQRRTIALKSYNSNFLFNDKITYNNLQGLQNDILINYNNIQPNALILVFYPKYNDIINYNTLLSANIISKGQYNIIDNIINFEILDKNIYMIPLSKEFSNFYNIQDYYKKNYNNKNTDLNKDDNTLDLTKDNIINLEFETSEDLIYYNLDIIIIQNKNIIIKNGSFIII